MSKNVHHDPSIRREDWETPQWLFSFLRDACGFNFEIDLAARIDNAKCRIFLDEQDDFLRKGHHNTGWAWCNPPYKKGGREMAKWSEALMRVPSVVALVPASVGAGWFQPFWDRARFICFLRGRLKFEISGEPTGPAPFDCALVIKGWNPTTPDFPKVYRLNEISNVVDLYR